MTYQIRGYCYKKWFFYVGWFLAKYNDNPELYYDNIPTYTMYSDPGIIYLTFGLTQKQVIRRMGKICNKKLLKKYPTT